jgi:predicted transcriptional regulator
MAKRQITLKVGSLEETLARFNQVWESVEHGEKIVDKPLEVVSFENVKVLLQILSPKRLELLQQLHEMGKTSIRALAKKLMRDYRNVHEDIKTLYQAGLVLLDSSGKYYMPWDKIITEIPMSIIPIRRKTSHPRAAIIAQVAHR